MRPVNKGASPYETIKEYGDALPHLERAIGLYCSYCGFPIPHVPEVEHISAKSHGGEVTKWENLLLGCKYCNSRKNDRVTPDNIGEYIWPDTHNTAIAFTYEDGVPKVNTSGLMEIDSTGEVLAKAENLFSVIDLGNIPTPSQKDRRFENRHMAYDIALKSLANWKKNKSEELKEQIIFTAMGHGFFPVWMTVFKDESEILTALIEAFPGTRKVCFDEKGHPKPIITCEE